MSTSDKASRKALLAVLERQPKGQLECAICEYKSELALMLIANADQETRRTNEFALNYAACLNDIQLASALIERGWDVNARAGTNGVARFPLLIAMGARHPRMVELLLQRGADLAPEPSKLDKVWISPVGAILSDRWLVARAATEAADVISCMSQALNAGWGIDRGLDEDNQKSLLWQAVTCRPLDARITCAVVKFLMERGASPLKRVHTYSILGWAIEKDCPEVIVLLLKQHTEQQLLERCDWSSAEDALCRAARFAANSSKRSMDCVAALLGMGGNPHSKNEVEQRLLPEAMRNRSRLRKMVSSGSTARTVTPMEIAMASGKPELKQLLLKYDTPRGYSIRAG
jgi:ankyrin repeat protein